MKTGVSKEAETARDRRGVLRRRIWDTLHGICLKLGKLQQTDDGRLACREVAEVISEARKRDSVHDVKGRRS